MRAKSLTLLGILGTFLLGAGALCVLISGAVATSGGFAPLSARELLLGGVGLAAIGAGIYWRALPALNTPVPARAPASAHWRMKSASRRRA